MCGAISLVKSPKLKARPLSHKRISSAQDLQNIYALGEVIGKGNFGTVIKAKHRETKIYWAIKLINKHQAGASRILLVEREIHILKLVNHPNIIFLDCVFESPKTIYLVFELCLRSLARTLKIKKLFNESETVNVLKNLSNAIAYLHKNDIVHRDIKLENILITPNPLDINDPLYIKVTDFGLSAIKQSGAGYDQMLHDFCGTLTYMAPEMVTTKSYSHQCDVWSMGIIMYTLLVGKFPFFSGNDQHLCKLICTSDIDYSALPCSAEAKHLLSRLLEKNPAFRITAAEVIHHPSISGRMGKLSIYDCNILQMMRMWRNEMLEISRDNSETRIIPKKFESNKTSTKNEISVILRDTPASSQLQGLTAECSKTAEGTRQTCKGCPGSRNKSSLNCSNIAHRKLSFPVPDFSQIPAKVDTNLSNLRRNSSRKNHSSNTSRKYSTSSRCTNSK